MIRSAMSSSRFCSLNRRPYHCLSQQGRRSLLQQPDVFKSPNSDSYIIFGEAKVEDLAAKQAALNAEQAAQRVSQTTQNMYDRKAAAAPESASPAAEEEAVDETGIDAKDIALVIAN